MKNLLVVGTSFCDDKKNPNIKKWPKILSDKLDLELINLSDVGISNLTIFNRIFSEIIQNENIDLIVASWSYGLKTNLFDLYEINLLNFDDDENEMSSFSKKFLKQLEKDEKVTKCFEQTLRLICYLQEFCHSKNIKLIHYPLLNLFYCNHMKKYEFLKNNYFFQRISKFNNILGWPSDESLGGYSYNTKYKGMTISKTDKHPNSIGQELIAYEIHTLYKKLF